MRIPVSLKPFKFFQGANNEKDYDDFGIDAGWGHGFCRWQAGQG
jgi:hypothetical protein